jgi:glycerol-3-phosphate dehydrogenase (NAD(P)+)
LKKATVIGAGSWGTALATVLAENFDTVSLWTRNEEDAREIQASKENKRYLPGVKLNDKIQVFTMIKNALRDASLVVLSVPSHAIRETVKSVAAFLPREAVLVNTAKGLEINTLLPLSKVMEEELPEYYRKKIAILSGPSHAEEVGQKIPTAVVSAAYDKSVAEYVQDAFMTSNFRVYTNPDVIGVELGGALKNIIALATGISDGLGFGDNSKAALITRGLTEIIRLGKKLGAESLTFAGLTGIGDLIVTCTSMHSRNRRAGIAIGKGKPLHKVLDEMGMVVEGVKTTKAAYKLSKKMGVEMPITTQVYRILYEGENPAVGVKNLMQRNRKHEVEEVVINKFDW